MASPAMTVVSSIISPSISPKSLRHYKRHAFNFKFATYRSLNATQIIRTQCSQSAPTTASQGPEGPEFDISEEESMSIDNLRRFINLNLGTWTGSFHQFDGTGNLLHKISTKLAAGSYGEDELISLIQTLYIKQPLSSVSVSGDDEEPQWAEYKIKESNMFTVDKYQQINFFPKERAFALRYQTAGMLDYILRQGVLGEDDIGEEFPRKLKLPSRRPSLVCESCLYSLEKDRRARAFHIMDPKGALDMLFIFLEERGVSIKDPPSLGKSEDTVNRIQPFLGHWKGHSVTNRSGVYGATIAEHETFSSFEIGDNGQLVQGITSTSKGGDEIKTNVRWTGTICENVVMFDGGFQLILLPGAMYIGCPCDVGNSVRESKSFHLEFCWIESPGKRQKLVRTYDVEGLAVSSTYFLEIRV